MTVAAAAGLAAALHASELLFQAIRAAGVAYRLFLGRRFMRSRTRGGAAPRRAR